MFEICTVIFNCKTDTNRKLLFKFKPTFGANHVVFGKNIKILINRNFKLDRDLFPPPSDHITSPQFLYGPIIKNIK